MSVTAEHVAQFADKRVVVVKKLKEPAEDGSTAVEVEGKVEAVNALGILVKPKGQSNMDLIELGDIEDIRLGSENRVLKARTLQPVDLGQGRQHLLDRHGLTLSEVNALSEEQAVEYHGQVDHKENDLGHVHGVKPSEEAAAEVEAKAAEQAAAPQAGA